MTLTPFGRVELDPTQVPIPAFSPASAERSFHHRLEAEFDQRRQEVVRRPAEADEPSGPVGAPAPEAAPEAAPDRRGEPSPLPAGNQLASGPARLPVRAPSGELATPGDRPARSAGVAASTGGATRLPLTAPAPLAPAPAAEVPPAHPGSAALPGPAGAPRPAALSVPEGKVAIQNPAATARPAPRVAASAPAYRTISPATLRMAEAARDSVFRQIAMRMNGEAGEMRVLLDPPELGQLDLHLVVEKGGTVHLSMVAERPELAVMLDKHMAELKQALQSQGLSIGNTEVSSREQGSHHERAEDDFFGTDQGDEQGAAIAPRRNGYITAEGLDYWV